MDSTSPVRVEVDGAVAELVLDRADKLNALDEVTLLAIEQAVDHVERRRSVRALVVRGEGRAFCAGADLTAAAARLDHPTDLSQHALVWRRVFDRLASSPVPSIAAVHGVAVAGGLELTLACDLVLIADDARIGDGHVRWGLVPSGGVSQRLPRLVGRRHASRLLLTGDLVDAEEARTMGLVNAVVPAARLLEEARALARAIADRSPAAVASLKHSIAAGLDLTLRDGLDLEHRLLVEHQRRPDMSIGQSAFTDRSRPAFPDR